MAKTILVVDDEPNIVMMLESRLAANGYEVVTATDGIEALKKVRRETPDAIILDIVMPRMDGVKLCNILKEDRRMKNIPVIFLTALRTKEEEEADGERVAGQTIFAKPFRSEDLLAAIEDVV